MFYIFLQRALMHFCILLFSIFFSVFFSLAIAQDTQETITVNKAISLTLSSNPQLHQYIVKKEGLQGQRASSDLSPELNLGLEFENFGGSNDFSGIDATETTVALSSVIELGSKRSMRVSVVDARLNLLEYEQQAFTLDVLADVVILFLKTLEIQEIKKVMLEAHELAKKTLVIVKNRSDLGATPESEVKRATASVAQIQLQLDALQQQHERNRIRLASFWGVTSPNWQQLEGDLFAFGRQKDFSSLYQQALTSPSIEIFASDKRLKTAQLQLAQTQTKPDLSWQVGVRRFEASDDSAFIFGMSIPLFSNQRNRGTVATVLAAQNEVELQRRSALMHLHTQLFDAYSQRKQHISATKILENTIIPELRDALQSTQHAYERGRYSYQDWIAAQKELLGAKQMLIETAAAASLNQAVIEQLIAEPLNH